MKKTKDKKKHKNKNLMPKIMGWFMLLIMVGGIIASILVYFISE